MGLARQAILLTLVVHAVVLGFLVVWPASEGTPPSETFAEVDFVEADALPDMPEQSFEETMRQALAEKIANVRANAEASASRDAAATAASRSPPTCGSPAPTCRTCTTWASCRTPCPHSSSPTSR